MKYPGRKIVLTLPKILPGGEVDFDLLRLWHNHGSARPADGTRWLVGSTALDIAELQSSQSIRHGSGSAEGRLSIVVLTIQFQRDRKSVV